MPMAQLGALTLHYQVQGEGEPLLLIMGYRGSGFMWGEAFLALLAHHFRVITFDNRGTGLSDKPDTAYTIGMMADDAAALLTVLGMAQAYVFGVSMGGMIAQELALRYPRRVKRLILGCTSCGGPQAIVAAPEILRLFLTTPGVPRAEALQRQWRVIFSAPFVTTHPQFLAHLTQQALAYPTPFHTAVRQMYAMQRFNTYGRLGQILLPTLILTGDQDVLVPPANSLLLTQRIPAAAHHLIAGTGHGFFWEAPQRVTTLLQAFCSRR